MGDKIIGMISLAKKAGKVKDGLYQCKIEIESGRAKLVIISCDAKDNTLDQIVSRCKAKNIPYIKYSDKKTLGKCIGKPPKTAIAVCDENFSGAILKLYGGGKNGESN